MKIDGKQIANKILEDLRLRIIKLQEKNVYPQLAVILVGNDPASTAYVRQKELKAKEIGIKTSIYKYPNSVSEKELLQSLNDLNHLSTIHGIIVQQPLPSHVNPENITQAIDPKKDVDGFHSDSHFQMPIAMAVLEILEEIAHLRGGVAPAAHLGGEFKNWLRSKKIVIIGKGETGGKPIIQLFEKMKVPLTIIDSKTEKPESLIKKSDIVISAVGKPNVVTGKMLKQNAILIGIGISRDKNAKLVGDYVESGIEKIASFYTPTPGGVGPVNVAMLLKNLIISAENSSR